MSDLNDVFKRMDSWRHFPNYQLERRADIFFSLFLNKALQNKTGKEYLNILIPEFPVRIGTINNGSDSNQSKKIDYLAVSKDGKEAVFIELKTDINSLNDKQNDYLQRSQKEGLYKLLEGIITIFKVIKVPAHKRKYFYLLEQLEAMGLVKIDKSLKEIFDQSHLSGFKKFSGKIEITSSVEECNIVYILPTKPEDQIKGIVYITFEEFAESIDDKNDPMAKRFSESLIEWAEGEAGSMTGSE